MRSVVKVRKKAIQNGSPVGGYVSNEAISEAISRRLVSVTEIEFSSFVFSKVMTGMMRDTVLRRMPSILIVSEDLDTVTRGAVAPAAWNNFWGSKR